MITLLVLSVLLLIIISMWVMGFAVLVLSAIYFFTLDLRKDNHVSVLATR